MEINCHKNVENSDTRKGITDELGHHTINQLIRNQLQGILKISEKEEF